MLLSDDVASMHGDASQHGASSHGAGVTVGSAKSSPLCELPKDLLLEVLHSDELTTECVSEAALTCMVLSSNIPRSSEH